MRKTEPARGCAHGIFIEERQRACRLLRMDHIVLVRAILYDRADDKVGLILPDMHQFIPAMVLVEDLENHLITRSWVVWREGPHASLASLSLPQDTRFAMPETNTDWEDMEPLETWNADMVGWLN